MRVFLKKITLTLFVFLWVLQLITQPALIATKPRLLSSLQSVEMNNFRQWMKAYRSSIDRLFYTIPI